MKKSLVTLLLVLAAAAAAQEVPATAAGQQSAAAPAQQQQNKVIKDPAEYNAYIAAVKTTDPKARAAALESFLSTYPNSVMKEDGTELLMKTYQQLNDVTKITETGKRLLQIDPNNLTGLALMSYLDRAQAQSGGPQATQLLSEAGQLAQRGLQQLGTAQKPEGYSDEQWATMKQSFKSIFLGSAGHAALQDKDYATAQKDLKEVVTTSPNPNDPANFTNVYLLSLAYLSPKPMVIDGLWWIARAVALAPAQAKPQILNYAKGQYMRYHGSDTGFNDLVQEAATSPNIPPNFTVAPAPTPAEQAAAMVAKTPPEQMSFADWQFIMTSGNTDAANQVMTAIQGKPVQIVAQVIDASPTQLTMAASSNDIADNKADLVLTMVSPIPAKLMPKVGAQIPVQGKPDSFTTSPFMMQMVDGKLLTKAGAEEKPAPKKRAPVRRRK